MTNPNTMQVEIVEVLSCTAGMVNLPGDPDGTPEPSALITLRKFGGFGSKLVAIDKEGAKRLHKDLGHLLDESEALSD